MRVIRTACDILGLDSNVILKHSFSRGLYAVKLANNFRSYLHGKSETPRYRNLPLEELVGYWRNRWLNMRRKNMDVVQKVRSFSPQNFMIA